jgi:hypothetical protein
MHSNGIQLHEVESAGIHYNFLGETAVDNPAEPETCGAIASPLPPAAVDVPDTTISPHEAGYTELLEILQALEAHAWDVKKRGESLQDMVEDVVESPTVEPGHRESLLETAKTLCTDLQDLYRTIRVVLKTQTPDYQTAVWKKSSRSRK